ncbi:MAG: ATP-dependent DNA ligase [Aquabacterium sp.]|jgi:DNA ligase-1
MQGFAQLFLNLDASTSTRHKVEALQRYWREAPPADAAWAVYFLAGGRPRRGLSTTALRQWAAQAAGVDEWLFEASYAVVGDLAETMAHLLPHGHTRDDTPLHRWMTERLLPWRERPLDEQLSQLSTWVQALTPTERFVLFKLIGGGWRVGVSRQLVIRSLAEHAGLPAPVVAQRMMGYTDAQHQPTAHDFEQLVSPEPSTAQGLQPYPFFLAHPLDGLPDNPVNDWMAEWKFDGIRAQIVRRQGNTGLWSRGEELLNEAFPDLLERCQHWPDGTVLDGEIVVRDDLPPSPQGTMPLLPWNWRPAPFARLQTRIRRKQVTRAVLREHPVEFVPYDLLEWQGQDLRRQPQSARRTMLEHLAPTLGLTPSPLVPADDWPDWQAQRLRARDAGLEGLMLKHRDARYGTGRTRSDGVWLKWKLDPMTVDAVLVYAQAGHGRRANLYTDYTLAVWNRPPVDEAEVQAVLDAIAARQPPSPGGLQLVTFAKAYSGLTDEELRAVDKVIRQTTVERYGPVRSLRPSLVFELGFEGIGPSPRHKSGVAVRFPRILRWRTDKRLQDADTMTTLQRLAQQ